MSVEEKTQARQEGVWEGGQGRPHLGTASEALPGGMGLGDKLWAHLEDVPGRGKSGQRCAVTCAGLRMQAGSSLTCTSREVASSAEKAT